MKRHPASRVRLNPAKPNTMLVGVDEGLRIGLSLMADGRLEQARVMFDNIRLSAPQHPTALTMLSSISYQLGDEECGRAYHDHAIDCLERMADLNREDPGIIAPLVNLLLARGDIGQAEALSSRLAIGLNPIRCTADQFSDRLARAQKRSLPAILLATLPKTASETIWNRLAAGLAMPQAHASLGLFPNCCILPARLRACFRGGIILKDHIAPTAHNVSQLKSAQMRRIIVHLRDPRQILVSWAHFVRDDVAQRMVAPIWRQSVPPRHILKAELSVTIDWLIENYMPLVVQWIAEWLKAPAERGMSVVFTTYEEFQHDWRTIIDRILSAHGIDRDQFDMDAASLASDIHFRAGRLDEWRDILTHRQKSALKTRLSIDLCQRFDWPLG